MSYNPDWILDSWKRLNHIIMTLDNEEDLKALLERELTHRKRGMYAFRIYSRYNKMRGARERAELLDVVGHDTSANIAIYPELTRLLRETEDAR
jgi:hypothetical protein